MINTKYKIYLDMDGVIADWKGQFKKKFGYPVEAFDSRFGKEKRQKLVQQNSPLFYENMPWTKDGKILFNFLKQFPTEILSHSTDDQCKQGKQTWLQNKNINLTQHLVDNRQDKAKYAGKDTILIDDREDNIAEFQNAGGIGILHKNSTDTINKLKEILGVKQSHRIYNSILNPELFNNDILKPEVVEQLYKIAREFYKETELEVPIEDIVLLGSSAGYNWTPTSDLDLHIIIDFSKIDENTDLVKKAVDGYKNKWNNFHDIYINEHPVELYIQDINEENKSQAVYSITKNEWITKPKYESPNIDKIAIKRKYKELKDLIDRSVTESNIENLKSLVRRIYNMREAGLSSGGEYSTENLVFKLLRSNGYVDKVRDSIINLTDKQLSRRV